MLNYLSLHTETGTGEAKGEGGTVPSKRGARKEQTMKTSIIKIVAALAIGAAFPLGAIAAQPTNTTTEQGVIQQVKAEKVKSPRKHYFATPWMES